MRGNATGYHDSLVCLGVHFEERIQGAAALDEGDIVSIVDVGYVMDSSCRILVDLPDTVPQARAHARERRGVPQCGS